jgi:hypothetical protein
MKLYNLFYIGDGSKNILWGAGTLDEANEQLEIYKEAFFDDGSSYLIELAE